MEQEKSGRRGGMVIYPRAYHTDDTSEPDNYRSHFIEAVDEANEPCLVYIHPSRDAVFAARNSSTNQTIPLIENLADDRPMAKNPCVAYPENGPDRPEGVLLAEQIQETTKKLQALHPGKRVIIAKWASVLSPRVTIGMPPGSAMPPPVIGKGYLEIGFHPVITDETQALIDTWVAAREEAGDEPSQAQQDFLIRTAASVYESRRKWFVATIIKDMMITTIHEPSMDEMKKRGKFFLEKLTEKGRYGGVIFRARRDGVVDSGLSVSCNMQYFYQQKRVKTFEETWEDFAKFQGGKLLAAMGRDPSLVVDVIPVQRINCGKPGNDMYSQDLGPNSKVMRTYVERHFAADPTRNLVRENGFLYADVAIRVAEARKGGSKGNQLVSAIHAFSAPLGNVLTIPSAHPRHPTPELTMDYQQDRSVSPDPGVRNSAANRPQPAPSSQQVGGSMERDEPAPERSLSDLNPGF